jgi:hypothetical protein
VTAVHAVPVLVATLATTLESFSLPVPGLVTVNATVSEGPPGVSGPPVGAVLATVNAVLVPVEATPVPVPEDVQNASAAPPPPIRRIPVTTAVMVRRLFRDMDGDGVPDMVAP